MTPQARAVASALNSLCFRAGVSPFDGCDRAGLAVCERLASEGVTGAPSCPADCPISAWLRRQSGVGSDPGDPLAWLLLVGVTLAMVWAPRVAGRRGPAEFVRLPKAVRAAIRRIAERKAGNLTGVA